jgi:hypothetical protein
VNYGRQRSECRRAWRIYLAEDDSVSKDIDERILMTCAKGRRALPVRRRDDKLVGCRLVNMSH